MMTKKEFREFLNAKYKEFNLHKHNRYHQLKRGYGDYLWFQDREKFNVLFNEKECEK